MPVWKVTANDDTLKKVSISMTNEYRATKAYPKCKTRLLNILHLNQYLSRNNLAGIINATHFPPCFHCIFEYLSFIH